MQQHLVISAIGRDRPGLLKELSGTILDSGCHIEDSRMVLLGAEFAILLIASGSWSAVAKLEAMLPALKQRLDLAVLSKRTESRPSNHKLMPYAVEAISLDQPNIVHELAYFFASRNITIEELSTRRYPALHTGAPLFSVSFIIHLPVDLSIAILREQFMELCDNLNLDAILEPIRGR
ncbi:glycine cleavage system protein R [Nitrosococcus wardiae]|uniref:Glycine cleavage system transcriptional repressor n=1 Tax=Nitrosococcus wardiae TaxID=1814290 RepID=A0A4P7BTM1_9GAMM|nr:glycine cleavage system protein R [Nitrosococcus wardiae]QBQ53243.1 glycine cleavage system protein R [Nitrosococcus wardiae]